MTGAVYAQVSEWLRDRGWSVLSDHRGHLAGMWFDVEEQHGCESPPASGVLLALVREAYGPKCRVGVFTYEDGSTLIHIHDDKGLAHGDGLDAHVTLGLALAAALLAAPSKQEPPP